MTKQNLTTSTSDSSHLIRRSQRKNDDDYIPITSGNTAYGDWLHQQERGYDEDHYIREAREQGRRRGFGEGVAHGIDLGQVQGAETERERILTLAKGLSIQEMLTHSDAFIRELGKALARITA